MNVYIDTIHKCIQLFFFINDNSSTLDDSNKQGMHK